MRAILTCLLVLLFGSASFAQGALPPPPPKTINIYNNEPAGGKTIYPVISLGNKPVDNWLIAWFLNCNCYPGGASAIIPPGPNQTKFATTPDRNYFLFVNGAAGIPPGGSAIVTLPFFSQLVTPANGNIQNGFIDWWNGGRVFIYDDQSQVQTFFAGSTQLDHVPTPPSLSCTLPTGSCSQLQITYRSDDPAPNDHYQLTEFTFADALTGSWPYVIKTAGVGYNISSVDHTYLPIAMAPIRAAPQIPYIGTIMSVTSFRAILNSWLGVGPMPGSAGKGWPLFKGSDATNPDDTYIAPRIPGAFNAISGQNPYSASSDLAIDCKLGTGQSPSGPCTPLNLMLGIYDGCLTSTAGICQYYNPLINGDGQVPPPSNAGLFATSYATWFANSCRLTTLPNTPLQFAQQVYGWVPFTQDNGTPGCAGAILNPLSVSAGTQANFNTLLNSYINNLQTAGSKQTPSFNPYVLLVLDPAYLNEAAYAFSVNDTIGFQSYVASGIYITFSGDGVHCPQLPVCVPLDPTKKVTVNLGVLRTGVAQWNSISLCDPTVPIPVDPSFSSIAFFPQLNQLPCTIQVFDLANQLHSFVLNQQPPLTLGPVSNCSFPRYPNWCIDTKIVDSNDINTAADTPGPRQSTHDLNGDGYSDILWSNTSTGESLVWLTSCITQAPPSSCTVTDAGDLGSLLGYASSGQRDVDRDGKADLLWQQTSGNGQGNLSAWFMNGTSVVPPPPPRAQTWLVGQLAGWRVVGTADFNNDGMGDLLFQDGNNNYAVWLLQGIACPCPPGNGIIATGAVGNLPGWSVVGTGDFNGDGIADILWRDGSGNVAIWYMNGVGPIKGSVAVGNVPTTWSVKGTGDFNNDGMADIAWQDTSGNLAIWLMNGGAVLQSTGLGNVPNSYTLAATGDYNRDGNSDLLWLDASGNVSVWFMNGTSVTSTAFVGNMPTPWTILSTNSD
jgi:hypothetical protein